MKYKLMKRVVLLVICLSAISYFIFQAGETPRETVPLKDQRPGAIGRADDPMGRMKYDWIRLRNPVTKKIPDNIRHKEQEFTRTLPSVEALQKSGQARKVQTTVWTSCGAYNIGGRTRALGIDVLNENIILAGGVSGAMWRSIDGGANWTNTSDPLKLHNISCLAQDTRSGKTNVWYYGTGEYRGNSASGGSSPFRGDGIFRSTDGGASWNILPSTYLGTPHQFDGDFDYVWNIVIDPSNTSQDEVYAAVYGGITRSIDGGNSWTACLGNLYSGGYTDVAITSTGVLYATMSWDGSSKGIWRSTDGLSWVNITPAGWSTEYYRIVMGIAHSNENMVYFLGHTPYAGTNDHSIWKYTYLSGDGSGAGGQWEDRSANIPMYGPPVGDFDSQGSYDLVCKVKPDDKNTVFIGGTNLYRSTDGFATNGNTTWIGGYSTANNIMQYTNHYCDEHALVFYPSDPGKMLSGCDGGVSRTNNNLSGTVSWTTLNNGYLTTQYYTIAIEHTISGDNSILGGMQDRGSYYVKSTTPNTLWKQILSGDGCFCAIADGGSDIYVSWQYGGMYRVVIDQNGNETAYTRIDPNAIVDETQEYLFVNPFRLDPNDNKMMYVAAMYRLFRNSDLTAIPLYSNNPTSVNWTEMTNVGAVGDDMITALDVSKVPANIVYYGTHDGHVYRIDNAHAGNPAPTDVWTGKGLSSAYVSCIAIDPTDADKAMVVFSNYEVKSLFWTTDGGNSWTDVSGNLEQYSSGSGNGPSCRWVSILYYDSMPIYFVGTSTGLWSTTNLQETSTTWAREGSQTIGNVVVDMIDVRTVDSKVVIGTHGKGVFTSNISTGVDTEDLSIPDQFVLQQNYPNPFNPATTISYSLASQEHVTIKVYDMRGREVVTLVDEQKDSGFHKVVFDGSDLSSGVYLYKLRAGNFEQTRKLTLAR